MKKLVSVMLAVMMVAALAVTAFAATDINADEQRIVDAAAQTRVIEGKVADIPAYTQNELKMYLMRDEVDLTAEQADAVVGKINECFDYVEENGIADMETIKNMPYEQRKHLLTLAQEAGAFVDLVVTYDFNAKQLVFSDQEGQLISAVDTTIKFTGAETTTIVLLVAGVLVLIAGGAVVAKKAGLLA